MDNIHLLQTDITQLDVDAIVNAANTSLRGGGGVDGAIHRAAGAELLKACVALNGCPTGEAKITPGFRLKAQYITHTPGPVWKGGQSGEKELLNNSYVNSLKLASENKCQSIAFPNICTGVYGFPKQEAASIAVKAVKTFLKQHSLPLEVYFVCFDQENYSIYEKLLHKSKSP
jgi:O-acetyl-ADP-ribose deacetylase